MYVRGPETKREGAGIMSIIKLRYGKTGNSVCLVLPKEAVSELKAVPGEQVFLVRDESGAHRLTRFDQDFDEQIESARNVMKRYANTLKRLSK